MDEAASRELWDAAAATFDQAPDHGLRDPTVRKAWSTLLLPLIPTRSNVIDLGCGTGSLALLLAEAGHQVHALDQSPRMLDQARHKADHLQIHFAEGDATSPPFGDNFFDIVLSRHVLWAMPDPPATLARWLKLLRPTGTLILIEGHWSTGAGIPATECLAHVHRHRSKAELRPLTDPELWGGPITDERYLIISPAR
ncbi:class I SAM-dependent methyltransferase [Actinokineospora enzanensis]|uniref:class I SAM-dependent methyltransferase n=1 Tax=Actinokineospora enzanensis TaxID=155975 RepID=UPI00037F647C|nr:class I SAM-dependent methyltransferase [Actinokineospora enzanensis]